MSKRNIVHYIADNLGRTELETELIIQETLDAIIDVLAAEGRVELPNFGVFTVKKQRARQSRDSRAGARITVGERVTVTFMPAWIVEERVAMECRSRSGIDEDTGASD
jgi:nucleoid DNA-binding protein